MTPHVNNQLIHYSCRLEDCPVKSTVFDVGMKSYVSSASLVGIAFSFDSLSASSWRVPHELFHLSGSIPLHRTCSLNSAVRKHCGYVVGLFRLAMHQARHKRTSKGRDAELLRERKTSRMWKTSDTDTLTEFTAKTTPLKIQRTDITAQLIKPATVKRGDKWNEGVATGNERFKVRCRFRFLPVSQHSLNRPMSWYRDKYLKSDEWKSIRLEAIFKARSVCQLCAIPSSTLDVHHLDYKNLWDVKTKDLKAVCRQCHDGIHRLLKRYPKLKQLTVKRQWFIIRSRLSPGREQILDAIAANAKEFANPMPTRKELKGVANYYDSREVSVAKFGH